jgi:hypothetical protein
MKMPNTAPVVNSQTYGQANVAPGSVMTLTVNHSDVDRKVLSTVTTVTDSTGATGVGSPATCVIDGAASVVPVSTPPVVWTLVSATLNQSVFTGIAP